MDEPMEVPRIPAAHVGMGPPLEASWELCGHKTPRRILPVGAELSLAIRISEDKSRPASAARLVTNLLSAEPWKEFQTLPLDPAENGVFRWQKPLTRAGRFYVYGQYTLDGKDWFWMRGPPLLILAYPRQVHGMRMYIMIPTASGPLHTWHEQLRSIKELGFNMLHLLPLTRQGLSQSPYAASDLFQLEPDLFDPAVTPEPLPAWENFVANAAQLGMGLCLDLVLNHVAVDSAVARERPDWIVPDPAEANGLKRAGYMAGERWEKWDDLVLINYAHPQPEVRQQIWSYFRAYSLYWARFAARTRGMIRLDNLHSTYPPFASLITRELRRTFPELGILGEFFGGHDRLLITVVQDELDLLLATPWEHHFTHELRRYLRYLHESSAQLPWLCPVNSHDSGTPAQEFAAVGATRPRYLVSALLGTGATGLSQGVERGLQSKINFIGRRPSLQYAAAQDFTGFIKRVNLWLAELPQFQQGASIRFVDHEHPAVLAALRFCEDQPHAPAYLVVANMDIHNQQSITIDLLEPWLKERQLRELFTGQDIVTPSPALSLHLEPCGVRVIAASQQHP